MPDEPRNDYRFTSGLAKIPGIDLSPLVYVVIPGEPPEGRHYELRWLKSSREPVEAGTLIAQAQNPANYIKPRTIDIVAPESGVLLRSEPDPGQLYAVGETIGYIRHDETQTATPKTPSTSPLFTPSAASANRQRDVHESVDRGQGDRPEGVSARVLRMIGDRMPSLPPARVPPPEVRTAIAEPKTNSHGVFISYRRSDEAAFAGRLYDHFVNVFDNSTIFMDVDSIDLGLDFVEVLHEALSRCQVLIVVIGRSWLSATDELGAPRLDNPDDFVRLEVEAALQRGLRVIPVLVDSAPMPRSSDLPSSMAPLARRNGREVSNARFGSDTIELINTLGHILGRESDG